MHNRYPIDATAEPAAGLLTNVVQPRPVRPILPRQDTGLARSADVTADVSLCAAVGPSRARARTK